MPENLIIVHALHRTGSTSMHRYIRANVAGKLISHRHIFVNRWHKSYTEPGKKLVLEHGRENWKIVHLVRDPVARNLSHFWICDFHCNVKPDRPKLDTFRWRFLTELDHYFGINFIGTEIEPFWGIEIPTLRGFSPPYTVYGDRLAVVRYEDFDCRADLIRDFLGVEEKHEAPRMQCSGKSGEAEDYKLILENIRLPESYVDRLYNTRYMRTFYSRSEAKVLKDRWTKGIKSEHPIIRKPEEIRDDHDPETCGMCIQYRERRKDL